MRSELKPLGIKVHLYMPGNMDSPGFESENKTKPEITKQIEGSSTLVSPKDAAQFMLASMLSGRYYISNDILGELARISVNGGAPRPNIISEVQLSNKALVSPLLALIFTLWSNITDSEIGQYFEKNNAAKKNE
jgi:3-dehydrosphinganine reductase